MHDTVSKGICNVDTIILVSPVTNRQTKFGIMKYPNKGMYTSLNDVNFVDYAQPKGIQCKN